MNPQDIRTVACIGGGTIGSGWAVAFAMNGLSVSLYDVSEAALAAARAAIERSAAPLERCAVVDGPGRAALLGRISYTADLQSALERADYIQESVPETLSIKHQIVAAVEEYAPVTAIFGSSTSRMRISDICANAAHRERYIGAHPYNPPHLVPLVEISRGPDTSEETARTAYDFFKRIRKEPILLKKESLGFVANRYQAVLDREIADLVGRGVVSLEDANRAITYGPGFRYAVMGPSLVYDLGSPTGLRGLMANMAGSGINLLEDVANWTVDPNPTDPTYLDQVDAMRAALPGGAGASRESACQWRDEMLIAQLRLHNMI